MPELYTLDECLDLYADAFCIGRQRECLFLSLNHLFQKSS